MTLKTPIRDLPDLSRRLLTYEAAHNSNEENAPAAFHVCEKLRRPLSQLTGTAGFRSLMARALILAKQKSPALTVVVLKPDGSLDGLSAIGDRDKPAAAGGIIVAELLALLTVLIGKSFVLKLVIDIWPDLASAKHKILEKQR